MAQHLSQYLNMDSEQAGLCCFCSVLLELGADADPDNTLRKHNHHSSFGALTNSSKTCCLCDAIASSWKPRPLDFTGFSTEADPFDNPRERFSVEITTKATRLMASGVHWTLLTARFRSDKTSLVHDYSFTLSTCKAGGESSTRYKG